LIHSELIAQQAEITGKIIDGATNQIVPFANAVLTSKSDSTFFMGTVSDEKGRFTIEAIKPGKYNLELSLIGYQPALLENILLQSGIRDIGPVSLKVMTQNLDDVNIVAIKSPISYSVDRKVIDAGSFPGADVAMDLLENVPSLQVDFEGNLTYRGDGTFQVFINGHPDPNGVEKLKTIPAEKIDKIEIITNPSAKYDAEGTAGIIHVILKKNRLQGYAISTSVKADTRKSGEILFSIDKSGVKSGWYINLHLAKNVWVKGKYSQVQIIKQDSLSYKNTLEYKNKDGGNRSSIEVGFNYDITGKDKIDFSGYVNLAKQTEFYDKTGNNSELVLNLNDANIDSVLYNYKSNYDLFYQYAGGNLSYEHAFNKKRTHLLSSYIDVFAYLRTLEEKQIDSKEFESYTERVGFVGTEQNEVMIEGNISYAMPLSDSASFETGIEINTDHIPKVTSVSGTFNAEDNITPFPDEPLNQSVNFKQNIYAGFITFKSEWVKFALQLGGRVEFTDRTSDYQYETTSGKIEMTPGRNKFTDFFPTAHLTYNLSESHQLALSYSRRISRPGYWSLIPLKQYSDPFSYYTGNANLLPAYSNAIEFSYMKSWDKDFLGFEIFTRTTNNVTQNYTRRDTANILYYTPENVGNSISIGAEVMSGVNIFPWWNLNVSVSLYSYNLDVSIDGLIEKQSQLQSTGRLNNTFLLPVNFSIKWDVNYNGPSISAQSRTEDYFYSNLAVKKSFKDDLWVITLAGNNIFNSLKFSTTTKSINFYLVSKRITTPYVSLKVAYLFSNQK
jgi:outer membrane receptor protein involved in Fe transport